MTFDFDPASAPPPPDELAAQELRLRAAEDQWHAHWEYGPAPRNNPDIRPLVDQFDRTLRAATQILGLGALDTILSPATVQRLKNALVLYEAERALLAGQTTPEAVDTLARWLYGPAAEALRRDREQDEPES